MCLIPGRAFSGEVQFLNEITRLPQPWPPGTETQLWFSWGTGAVSTVPGTVDGSFLEFSMTSSETELIPRGSLARVEVRYGPGEEWIVWREGRVPAC